MCRACWQNNLHDYALHLLTLKQQYVSAKILSPANTTKGANQMFSHVKVYVKKKETHAFF